MPTLIVLRGCSGSGKSTLANKLIEDFQNAGQFENFIISTDHYWLRPDGTYDFNVKLLGQAHNWNFNRFKDLVENEGLWGIQNVILDNTNLQFKEFERYVRLAFQHGWQVEIEETDTDWKDNVEELYKKNIHNVPLDVIKQQVNRMESREEIQDKLEQCFNEFGLTASA